MTNYCSSCRVRSNGGYFNSPTPCYDCPYNNNNMMYDQPRRRRNPNTGTAIAVSIAMFVGLVIFCNFKSTVISEKPAVEEKTTSVVYHYENNEENDSSRNYVDYNSYYQN